MMLDQVVCSQCGRTYPQSEAYYPTCGYNICPGCVDTEAAPFADPIHKVDNIIPVMDDPHDEDYPNSPGPFTIDGHRKGWVHADCTTLLVVGDGDVPQAAPSDWYCEYCKIYPPLKEIALVSVDHITLPEGYLLAQWQRFND